MSRTRTLQFLSGALLVAALVVSPWAARRLAPSAPRVATLTTDISTATLEARYGLKVTRIAVTGGGGLVELRFTVLDAEKAKQLLRDQQSTPRLVAEDSGHVLYAPQQSSWRKVRVQQGAQCFVLFPNVRSAVKSGTRVALAFGALRVEPVVAL